MVSIDDTSHARSIRNFRQNLSSIVRTRRRRGGTAIVAINPPTRIFARSRAMRTADREKLIDALLDERRRSVWDFFVSANFNEYQAEPSEELAVFFEESM